MQSISFGSFALPLSQLTLFCALIIALLTGALASGRSKSATIGALLDIFLISLVFARIGFVSQYFEHYQNNLWRIIDIRDGGFSMLAGLAGVITTSIWKLCHHRSIRRPLSIAIFCGLLSWSTLPLFVLMNDQPRSLPDLNVYTLDGSVVSLQDFKKDQALVVNLWASWCPPCVNEMPVLQSAQKQHPEITFVFVNQGEQSDRILAFLHQQHLTLDNLFTDPAATFGQAAGSQALPTTLFYDAQGQQVDVHIGVLSHASLAHKLKSIQLY